MTVWMGCSKEKIFWVQRKPKVLAIVKQVWGSELVLGEVTI